MSVNEITTKRTHSIIIKGGNRMQKRETKWPDDYNERNRFFFHCFVINAQKSLIVEC